MQKLKLLFCLTFFSIIYAGNYQTPPIIVSTICGNLDEVKKECTPANINTQNFIGQTALMYSCINNSGDIFTFLMENNVDFNIKDKAGKTALDYAIKHNRREMIEFLYLSGANTNLSLDEALKKAAEIQNINNQKQNWFNEINKPAPDINVLLACLAGGDDVNARDDKGKTALVIAATNGQAEICQLLLAAGADVNARDENGNSALSWATHHEHTEIVNLLIHSGANHSGIPSLHMLKYLEPNLFKALIACYGIFKVYSLWKNFDYQKLTMFSIVKEIILILADKNKHYDVQLT